MKFLGLVLAIVGWLVAVGGVVVTSSLAGRYIFCVVGIAICLVGILKVLNGAHVKQAIWRK